MKKTIYIIVILSLNNIFGQDKSTEDYQIEYYNLAETALENSNERKALNYYYLAYTARLEKKNETKIEQKAKRIIDLLLPKFQKNEKKKWIGKWKLKQLKTDLFNYEIIEINDKNISFFTKEKDTIPIRVEKIVFAEFDFTDFYPNISNVIFENGEVWEFWVKKVNSEYRLFPDIQRDINGGMHILLDERSMIRDKKKREKALAEEIRTYYILE